jgi:2-amino-4-hydroxy-6-hydroxymethyldihydropteridine diphosphokinase
MISFGDTILPDIENHKIWVDLSLEQQIKTAPKELIVPHPRIQDRAFVLIPLRDVAPDWVHPVTQVGIDRLIEALPADDIASIRPLER